MSTVIASQVLANGLRTEFADTYEVIRNRQADSRLAMVMDLNVAATNRQHDFGYFEAAPHMAFWQRGSAIPVDAMDSVSFNVKVYEWGRRVPWSKWDRKDDQTQTLMQMARMAGESAALLPERFFFDLLQNATSTLPAVPNAPDGVAFFSATDGDGGNRFGATNGNLLTGTGTATAQIITDFYSGIEQFKRFQDGKGQPMLSDNILEGGFIVIHPVDITEEMETAFLQRQQIGDATAGGAQSNLVRDAARGVTLWGTSRLTDTNDWYLLLRNPPKQATFLLDREGILELSSLEGDNNSDHTRTTAEEYIQWERRAGAGIALPYGAIKITNA